MGFGYEEKESKDLKLHKTMVHNNSEETVSPHGKT